MQAEMDQLVFAAPAASSVSATPPTSLKKGGRGLSSSNVANRSGRIGGDPAGGWDNSGRILSLPACQAKFAWAPDRIAHELVCKLDQFTHRREDHMRKLLWTIGTDPLFDPAATGDSSNRNSILVRQFPPSMLTHRLVDDALLITRRSRRKTSGASAVASDWSAAKRMRTQFSSITSKDDNPAAQSSCIHPMAPVGGLAQSHEYLLL